MVPGHVNTQTELGTCLGGVSYAGQHLSSLVARAFLCLETFQNLDRFSPRELRMELAFIPQALALLSMSRFMLCSTVS